jgi:hypothetical protein
VPVLSTVARVKGALRIPAAVTMHDVRIGEILDEVESSALADIGADAWVASYRTEYPRTSPGRTMVLLEHFPVWAVAGATLDSSGLVGDSDFQWTRDGSIELLAGRFPVAARQFAVSYLAGPIQTAGSTPADLIRLATLLAARQFNTEGIAGLAASSVRPISKTVADPDDDAVQTIIDGILARYRKPMG